MYLLEVGKSLTSILQTEKNIKKVMLVVPSLHNSYHIPD